MLAFLVQLAELTV